MSGSILVPNKKVLKQRLEYANEIANKTKKQNEALNEKTTEEINKINKSGYRPVNNKELRRNESITLFKEKVTFLKEFLAESVYQALPIDMAAKSPLKSAITERVFDYFDSNAGITLAKSIAHLTNPGAKFNYSNISDTRIDEKVIRLFSEKKCIENSYKGQASDSGRVSFQDFLKIDTFNESVKELEPKDRLNATIEKLVEVTSKVINEKVIALMKEESEISEANNFLNENLTSDPTFKLKNKNIVAKAKKNTVFREVYRNVRLFNENASNPSEENFMAESLLELTIMEACNTLYLENLSPTERVNLLVKERQEHLASKR